MLELTEVMLHSQDERSPTEEDRRTVVRRLRCLKASAWSCTRFKRARIAGVGER